MYTEQTHRFKNLWHRWHQFLRRKFRYLDLWTISIVIGLMVFGCVMVYTASTNMASGSAGSFLRKQAFFAVFASIVMLIIFMLKIKWQSRAYRQFVVCIVLLLIGLLAITRLFGPVTSGAHGWLYLGGFGFQPVEYFKTALILWFAMRFAKLYTHPWYGKASSFFSQVIRMNIWGLPLIGFAFTLSMPDMGGALILMTIGTVMALVAGISPLFVVITIIAVAVLILGLASLVPFFVSLHLLQPYQALRFESFLDPWQAGDTGHQLINSYYALSNGGWFGRGLGNSIQKLGLLPEPNTDFIMAIVGEELGVVTIWVILALFAVLIIRLVLFGISTKNIQYRLILLGTASYITVQILVNLGGVTGLLPITGVTFPLISYGGSSLLSWGLTFGLVLNVIGCIRREQDGIERSQHGF